MTAEGYRQKAGRRRFAALPALLLAVMLTAGGCAPKEWSFDDEGAYDPVEPVNRAIYGVNKEADFFVLKPLAKGYRQFPPPLRRGAGNFWANLGEPANAVNNALQKKGDDAAASAGRFVLNSVFGIGGIFDVATPMGVPRARADFGQTLRGYGLGDTAYIVLPLIGPSSFADAIGTGADSYLEPARYLDPQERNIAAAFKAVHRRYEFLQAGDIAEQAALDEYSFVRDIYEEKRRSLVPARNGDGGESAAKRDGVGGVAVEYAGADGKRIILFPAVSGPAFAGGDSSLPAQSAFLRSLRLQSQLFPPLLPPRPPAVRR